MTPSSRLLTIALAAFVAFAAPVTAQTPAAVTPVTTEKKVETTPLTLLGCETAVYRKIGDVELRLHVMKPKGWTAGDKRPAFLYYFGGGWVSGTPESGLRLAKWAASKGLVGIIPDYRTRNRFQTTPEDSISDGRAAVRWVQEHATELGVDPAKLIATGGSAGGHVASWTAITAAGPAADDPAPAVAPAALILFNPVTDTKDGGYGGPKRFGNKPARALAASVPDQMQAKMPPTLVFHATADATVPYANSVAFRDKLVASGNRCELVTFEGLGHSYYSTKFGEAGKAAYEKTITDTAAFLASLGLL
jgi:acetyl esterase/lipase